MALSLRKIRLRLVWLLIIPFLWFARPTPVSLLLGSGLSVLGLFIRAWAAGFIRKDQQLATSGPYGYTRNPLYLGSFLLGGAYLSVSIMTSSLTRNQVISFILAVVICLFLVLAGWAPVTDILSGWAPLWLVQVVSGFSFMPHFVSIERGVLDLRDLFYYFTREC